MTHRLPLLRPSTLGPGQRALHEEITGGPRAAGPQPFALTDAEGRLHGPFNAMLLSPALGGALQSLGTAIRYASHLTPRIWETAILVVATAWDSAFERHAHERTGAAVGLTEPWTTRGTRSSEPPSANAPCSNSPPWSATTAHWPSSYGSSRWTRHRHPRRP
ncbi:conserved hypothetical protein [Streptomyces himastatinicus ATCC 53653]|uniref:Carboxymuconolactone decarboxylase n=1 Tax=Streptomyces himastatinicus ATCC 53653 TaxID=457427 RepID=D9WHD3_9ACTN|nr:hypothetical protein [Streptomyces himastatinicus]EFL29059.1 conserved hypothetical protein [Streptomyces himastatinicus ATCC 53653]